MFKSLADTWQLSICIYIYLLGLSRGILLLELFALCKETIVRAKLFFFGRPLEGRELSPKLFSFLLIKVFGESLGTSL